MTWLKNWTANNFSLWRSFEKFLEIPALLLKKIILFCEVERKLKAKSKFWFTDQIMKDSQIILSSRVTLHLCNYNFSNKKKEIDKATMMPSDVRWNCVKDCWEMQITHWDILLQICDQKRSAEDYLNNFKPILIALDTLQLKSVTLLDDVEQRKNLQC